MFHLYDVNNNGFLSLQEFDLMLKKLDFKINSAHVPKLFKILDKNNTEFIEFCEFEEFIR